MSAAMPNLIYGTAWKEERTTELVVQAIKCGFKGIDTACQPKHYHEAGVGEALLELKEEGFSRESLFIQSKFTPLAGHDPYRIPYDKDTDLHTQVLQSFETSQKNLHTDYLDSLVLHSPYSDMNDLESVYRAMESIHKDGGAKILGISNIYDPGMLQELYERAEIKPRVVQNRFYEATGYDKEIRAFCKQKGMVYQSFWTLTANPHILQNLELIKLASAYNKNVIQIFFAYLHQVGITPLTGTSSAEHMKSDLESFDIELKPNELEVISSLLEG